MRGHCTTEDEQVTASYCMFVQPEKSLDLFAVVRQETHRLKISVTEDQLVDQKSRLPIRPWRPP
jgi:hypothetical protein